MPDYSNFADQIQRYLRMGNIFGGSQMPSYPMDTPAAPMIDPAGGGTPVFQSETTAQAPPPPTNIGAIADYKPSSTLSDQYIAALGQMPTRNAQPSRFRNVLAGLSSLAERDPLKAQELADEVRDPQFSRDMADWKERVDALAKGSTIENYRNTNERLAATAESNVSSRMAKLEQDAKIASTKEAISRDRANAYIWKQMHPTHQLKEDDQGNLISIDPVTGKAIMVTGADGKPIKGSTLPDLDKINLQIEGRKDVARISANARTSADKPESESQQIAGIKKRAAQVKADPELGDFVTFDPNAGNMPTVTKPTTSLWGYGPNRGPTPEQYDKINEMIYGKGVVAPISKPPTVTGSSPVVQVPPKPEITPAPAGTTTQPPPPPTAKPAGGVPSTAGLAKLEPDEVWVVDIKTNQIIGRMSKEHVKDLDKTRYAYYDQNKVLASGGNR